MRKSNNLASRLAVAEVLGEDWRNTGGDKQRQAAEQHQGRPPGIDSAIPPLPAVEEPTHWHPIGRIEGAYTVAPQPAFAVVQIGPFQYKVTADDVILHPKLVGAEVNDVVSLDKVLLLGSPTVSLLMLI